MPSLIQQWTTPIDNNPPNFAVYSPLVGAGWTHLNAQFIVRQQSPGVDYGWSGAFNIQGGEGGGYWFNRYPQPASPFSASDPNQSYVTNGTDTMFVTANNGAPGLQVTVNLFGDVFGGGAYCQYGTRLKGAFPFVVNLTPAVIDAALVDIGQPYWAAIFTAFWYTNLNVQTLCGSGPPVLPPPDLSVSLAGLDTLTQYMRAILWPHFCECTPGAPTPTPYPAPGGTMPIGWPTAPSFSCSEIDLCASVIALRQQVSALSSQLSQTLELTTLLQRYTLPFAYIRGAVHSTLSGTGSFAVSRLVGIQVTVTLHSPTATVLGNPPYIFDQGWISCMDANGFIDERRVSQSQFSWFSKLMATATVIGYALFPGTVINVTELEAEP
jgi:hypothetical protein